jgi:hypothetical protein
VLDVSYTTIWMLVSDLSGFVGSGVEKYSIPANRALAR